MTQLFCQVITGVGSVGTWFGAGNLRQIWSIFWKLGPFFQFDQKTHSVINIEWDYNYYQPWSDNEWLVDEMLAILDKDIIMQ